MVEEVRACLALFETMSYEHGAVLFLPSVRRTSCPVHVPEQLPALLGVVRIFAWEVHEGRPITLVDHGVEVRASYVDQADLCTVGGLGVPVRPVAADSRHGHTQH